RPKTPTTPDQWILYHHHEAPSIWPEPVVAGLVPSTPELVTPSPQSFGVTDTPGSLVPVALESVHDAEGTAPVPAAVWPHAVTMKVDTATEVLPAPAAETFRYSRVWRPN